MEIHSINRWLAINPVSDPHIPSMGSHDNRRHDDYARHHRPPAELSVKLEQSIPSTQQNTIASSTMGMQMDHILWNMPG